MNHEAVPQYIALLWESYQVTSYKKKCQDCHSLVGMRMGTALENSKC